MRIDGTKPKVPICLHSIRTWASICICSNWDRIVGCAAWVESHDPSRAVLSERLYTKSVGFGSRRSAEFMHDARQAVVKRLQLVWRALTWVQPDPDPELGVRPTTSSHSRRSVKDYLTCHSLCCHLHTSYFRKGRNIDENGIYLKNRRYSALL